MFVWIVESKMEDGDWRGWDNVGYLTREESRIEKKALKRNYETLKFRIRKYVREEE